MTKYSRFIEITSKEAEIQLKNGNVDNIYIKDGRRWVLLHGRDWYSKTNKGHINTPNAINLDEVEINQRIHGNANELKIKELEQSIDDLRRRLDGVLTE